MARKIASIGWKLPRETVKNFQHLWQVDSLSNYEILFIDPGEFDSLWTDYLSLRPEGIYNTDTTRDFGLGRACIDLMNTRREEMGRLLGDKGGIVVCKLRPPGRFLQVMEKGRKIGKVDRYSWLPALDEGKTLLSELGVARDEGTETESIDLSHPLGEFLQTHREDLRYKCTLKPVAESASPADGVLSSFSPIAYSPEGRIVAAQISVTDGEIIFVPCQGIFEGDLDCSGLVEVILQLGSVEPSWKPQWLSQYSLSKEQELVEKIESLDNQIEHFVQQKNDYRDQLTDLVSMKKVLCSRSRNELSSRAQRIFEEFGFEVERGPGNLGFLIRPDEGQAIAISCGAKVGASVGIEPCQSLLWGIEEFALTGQESVRGLVVVNGYAEVNPRQRPKQYDELLEAACKRQQFKLETALNLFQLFREASEKNFTSDQILEKLLSSEPDGGPS